MYGIWNIFSVELQSLVVKRTQIACAKFKWVIKSRLWLTLAPSTPSTRALVLSVDRTVVRRKPSTYTWYISICPGGQSGDVQPIKMLLFSCLSSVNWRGAGTNEENIYYSCILLYNLKNLPTEPADSTCGPCPWWWCVGESECTMLPNMAVDSKGSSISGE